MKYNSFLTHYFSDCSKLQLRSMERLMKIHSQSNDKAQKRQKSAFLTLVFGAMVIFCFAYPAMAQDQRKIVLNDTQFKESYLEKVTVSGGIRAGFMHQSNLEHIDLNKLYVHLQHDIKDQDAMLCVNMVSRDGRYAASWQYPLGEQQTGSILVNMPSKYQDQISNYAPDSLVVLAAITKKDCLSKEIQYVPVSWGDSATNDYVLYVNSGNTDTEIGIPGSTGRIHCAKINADSTIAYDTKCMMKTDILTEPKSIFILRNNFGKRLPNVEFPVR